MHEYLVRQQEVLRNVLIAEIDIKMHEKSVMMEILIMLMDVQIRVVSTTIRMKYVIMKNDLIVEMGK